MHSPSPSLTGRVALVTGAGVGIGKATALALGFAGAKVAVHYHRSREGAEQVVRELASAGVDAFAHPGDLMLESDAHALVDRTVERLGGLDILVNNAGALLGRATIAEATLDLWRRTLDVNLTSAFLVTRRAIPHLKRTGHGAIVNVISLSAQTGGANGAGAYAAAKGGLAVFTRTLARELAPSVRTNTVCPGVIETRHHEQATTPQRMEQYRKETPLARNGQANEVAEAIRYLASDAAAFINGAMLDINGGRFLRS